MHDLALCKRTCLLWVLGIFATSCFLRGFGSPTVVGCLASIVACRVSPADDLVLLRGATASVAHISVSFNKKEMKIRYVKCVFFPFSRFCFPPTSHEIILIPHEFFGSQFQIGYPFAIIDFHLSFLSKNILV